MIRTPNDMKTEVRPNMRGGTGSVTVRHMFTPDEFGAKVRLAARLLIPPGASIGTHQHTGEDEIYIVLKGTGSLDDGKTVTPVAQGDAILTGRGESHAIANTGATDLEMIAVIACYA